ncbi:MAG: sigma-70 family RNA polymerase sigma factor [Tunicatimonas sp.]
MTTSTKETKLTAPDFDHELWDGVRHGQQSAFASLYQKYFKVLFRYGMKLSKDRVATEDAIHDLFVDLWRYHQNLSPTGSIEFYLLRALRRKIHKNTVAEKRVREFEGPADVFLNKELTKEERWIQTEQAAEFSEKIGQGLAKLPERQRASTLLRFYQRMSYPEIAQALGINEQSARNLIRRSLNSLRGSLKDA